MSDKERSLLMNNLTQFPPVETILYNIGVLMSAQGGEESIDVYTKSIGPGWNRFLKPVLPKQEEQENSSLIQLIPGYNVRA